MTEQDYRPDTEDIKRLDNFAKNPVARKIKDQEGVNPINRDLNVMKDQSKNPKLLDKYPKHPDEIAEDWRVNMAERNIGTARDIAGENAKKKEREDEEREKKLKAHDLEHYKDFGKGDTGVVDVVNLIKKKRATGQLSSFKGGSPDENKS